MLALAKFTIDQKERTNTAVAFDYDGDGQQEIIYAYGKTIKLSSLDGKQRVIHKEFMMHSQLADLNGDGRPTSSPRATPTQFIAHRRKISGTMNGNSPSSIKASSLTPLMSPMSMAMAY